METVVGIGQLLEVSKSYGLAGVFIVIFIVLLRMVWQQAENYRADMTKVLNETKMSIDEIRRMYENNVGLVKSYETIASDMHGLIVMSTQTHQQLCDEIRTNQYCPYVRLEKKAKGMQG